MARVPYNKLLTNLASSSRTGEYWPLVVFLRTSLGSVRTPTTSGQYSPVRPSRSVSKRLVLEPCQGFYWVVQCYKETQVHSHCLWLPTCSCTGQSINMLTVIFNTLYIIFYYHRPAMHAEGQILKRWYPKKWILLENYSYLFFLS